jgi:hypothetical protein
MSWSDSLGSECAGSDRRSVSFAGADAHRAFDVEDENLAVPISPVFAAPVMASMVLLTWSVATAASILTLAENSSRIRRHDRFPYGPSDARIL